MDGNNEAIVQAVEEVSSVAAELKRLRDSIKQYSDASQRLKEIGTILEELNAGVGKIHGAFTSALEHVAATHGQAQTSKDSIEKLVNSVPEIVERIESSDTAVAARSVNESVGALSVLIRAHEKSLNDVSARLASELISQTTTLSNLRQRVDAGLEAVDLLTSEVRQLRESATESSQLLRTLNGTVSDDLSSKVSLNQKSMSELIGLMDQLSQDSVRSEENMNGHAGNILSELVLLKEQMASAQRAMSDQNNALERHGALLNEMSKRKKGWFG